MQFFIDTANIEEIKQAHAWGVISGVTTNPSLVAKEGRNFEAVIKGNCQYCGWTDQRRSVSLVSDEMKGSPEACFVVKNIVIRSR